MATPSDENLDDTPDDINDNAKWLKSCDDIPGDNDSQCTQKTNHNGQQKYMATQRQLKLPSR
jgi:hypothetical protein